MSAAVLDHPPLRALARYLEMPPATVAPTYLRPSDHASLSIVADLDGVLSRAHQDLEALPLLTPTAIQMAAIAVALAGQRLLPFPTHTEALHQLVGLMQNRVLCNTHRDRNFHHLSSRHHFERASDHFLAIHGSITTPASSPQALQTARTFLTDLAVYLVFATYATVPSLTAEPEPPSDSGGTAG
jgi:hypothetical protein